MKVLVPLDGSTVSLSVLRHVRRVLEPSLQANEKIAGYIAAIPADDPIPRPSPLPKPVKLHFLRVLDSWPATQPVVPPETQASMEREAEESLESVAREHFPDVETVCHIVWSRDPATTIIEFAEAFDVDAIAMATHGRSGVSRLLAGSVAERVIRESERPVIVHRPRE
jgi:nucleotide-binding universal stress UspA family protein